MSEGKAKYIEDAARLIDGRVAALKAELERDIERLGSTCITVRSDRAAILEAEHCARLIRLLRSPYRGDPHEVASGRFARGE